MDWSQTPRVLLEWPDEGKILRNRLDLVLLERYCSTNGSQLALLTKDQQVIDQAEEAGIPVFQIRSIAQLQPWGKSFREFIRQDVVHQSHQPRDFPTKDENQKIESYQLPLWARILLFTLAVAAVLAIGGTLLPSATVSLSLDPNRREISIPVQAIQDQESISISGIIPSRMMEIVVQDQISIAATGTLSIPSEYARGEVIFTNLGTNSIQIPKNTILSTSQVSSPQFKTVQAGTTPDGIGGQIILPIEALEPGSHANLPENMVTRINHDFGAELSVINPSPITGGADISVPAPSDDDRTKATKLLSSNLIDLALEQVNLQLNAGDILLNSQPEIGEVIETIIQPEIGSAGDTLTLTIVGQFSYNYASAADLMSLTENAVSTLYTGSMLKPELETITITQKTKPEFGTDHIARWELQISWDEYREINKQDVIQAVLGKKPADAEIQLMNALDLDSLPDIQVIPSWWFRIPVLPFRINILEAADKQ